jgi:hypothetical protein
MTASRVPYATPQAMRHAVLAHAGNAAQKGSSARVDQLLRQFSYGRLLARLFMLEPERWVLKGATGLLARVPEARHSLDVDLWRGADGLEQAEQAVERAADLDLGDHVRLRIGEWREHTGGNRPLARTTVLCQIGERPLIPRFGLDVVTGPPPPLPLRSPRRCGHCRFPASLSLPPFACSRWRAALPTSSRRRWSRITAARQPVTGTSSTLP